jgi:hypothetical protein
MTTPPPNPQALIAAAKQQTAANRYALIRRTMDSKLMTKIVKS